MARYLCQSCNGIGIFGENHTCFGFWNNRKVRLPPKLKESNRKRKMYDDAKDKLKKNTSYISVGFSPDILQREKEKSEVPFTPASPKMGRDKTFSEMSSKDAGIRNVRGTSFSGSTLKQQRNVEHSERNASSKAALKSVEPCCTSEGEIWGSSKRTSVDTGRIFMQETSEAKVCHQLSDASDEEYLMSLEEIKWPPFYNDKEIFMDSPSSRKCHLPYENSSEISNFTTNSDFSCVKKESDDSFDDVSDLNHNSSEAASETDIKREEMATSGNELKYSKKNDDEAGSSGMHSSKKHFPIEFNFNHPKINRHDENKEVVADEKAVVAPSGIWTRKKRYDKNPKKFTSKTTIKNCYDTHTGEKPFSCDVCKRQFSRESGLSRHYRIHTSEKPFVCDECGKAFAQKTNRDIHCRNHTGEKPFVCDVCKKTCSSSNYLTRHIRSHHLNKPL